MSVLIIDSIRVTFDNKFDMLQQNWNNRTHSFCDNPNTTDATCDGSMVSPSNFMASIFYGVSSAMLGITGFETSANYVEEQAPGVFVKTLRNMWYCVAFFNPVLSFLSLCVLPLTTVQGYPFVGGQPNSNSLLLEMAQSSWMKNLISIDAFLVLAGAVLTAYVGINGLILRMASDRILPSFLTATNSIFKTNHYIIFGFLIITTSLFFIANQNVLVLAGVYAISFLSVMTTFAVGNLILKYKRSRIKREYKARVSFVLLAMLVTVVAIAGNLIINTNVIKYFLVYYGFILLVIGVMFQRARILKMAIRTLSKLDDITGTEEDKTACSNIPGWRGKVSFYMCTMLMETYGRMTGFLIKDRDIRLMNKAITYILSNEDTKHIKFINVSRMDAEHRLGFLFYLYIYIYIYT